MKRSLEEELQDSLCWIELRVVCAAALDRVCHPRLKKFFEENWLQGSPPRSTEIAELRALYKKEGKDG